MKKIKILSIAMMIVTTLSFVSCSSDPEYADPEAHEKTELLQKQYGPAMVGTWHFEQVSEKQKFFEQLTFQADGTFTGIRKWATHSMITIDGEQRYSDWEDMEEECGTFAGTWSLRYWSPEGTTREKRNCLSLMASFDTESQHQHIITAYSNTCDFGYANATTLYMQGIYYNGWISYQRGEAKPSF